MGTPAPGLPGYRAIVESSGAGEGQEKRRRCRAFPPAAGAPLSLSPALSPAPGRRWRYQPAFGLLQPGAFCDLPPTPDARDPAVNAPPLVRHGCVVWWTSAGTGQPGGRSRGDGELLSGEKEQPRIIHQGSKPPAASRVRETPRNFAPSHPARINPSAWKLLAFAILRSSRILTTESPRWPTACWS